MAQQQKKNSILCTAAHPRRNLHEHQQNAVLCDGTLGIIYLDWRL